MGEDLLPHLVYGLCALTSLLCAILVLRSYRRARTRLLFVVALGFVGLAVNNLLMVVDLLLGTLADLSVLRSSVGLATMAALLVMLIWEER
jgi:hypothetical protein